MSEALGSYSNPIPQDYIWCEELATGQLVWYCNKNGGIPSADQLDLSAYMQKAGGTFTGDIYLPEHPSYDTLATQAAISKGDFETQSLKVLKVSALPGVLRPNTLYLVTNNTGV